MPPPSVPPFLPPSPPFLPPPPLVPPPPSLGASGFSVMVRPPLAQRATEVVASAADGECAPRDPLFQGVAARDNQLSPGNRTMQACHRRLASSTPPPGSFAPIRTSWTTRASKRRPRVSASSSCLPTPCGGSAQPRRRYRSRRWSPDR